MSNRITDPIHDLLNDDSPNPFHDLKDSITSQLTGKEHNDGPQYTIITTALMDAFRQIVRPHALVATHADALRGLAALITHEHPKTADAIATAAAMLENAQAIYPK